MRWIGRILLVLLLVIVGGVGFLVLTFDPESYKPQITDAVKQATGRDLQIKGKIGFAWSLNPTIEVSDVTLSNPAGYSRPEMMSVKRVDLQLALIPLISKHVEIDRLILVNPDVRLETDGKGVPNWQFAKAPATPAPAPTPAAPTAPVAPRTEGNGSAPMTVAVKDIRLEDGVFTYREGRTGQTNTVTVKQLVLQQEATDAPLHASVSMVVDGTQVELVADTGALGHLTGAIKGIWTVKVTVALAGAKLSVDGGIGDPLAGTGLDLNVTGSVPDLAALGSAVKQDLPALKTVSIAAKVTGDPRKLSFHDVKLASSAGDLSGDLTIALALPISVSGSLASQKLDIDALSAAMKSAPAQTPVAAPAAPPPAPTASPTAPAPAAPAKPKWLIPDRPLPLGQLQLVNADLQLALDLLHVGAADYKAVKAHVVVKDGALTLDPASADLPQGHVALTLSADGAKPTPPVHVTAKAPGIALAPLLAALGEPPYISGNLEVIADLRGAGESPHAIASTLDGTLALAVPGGSLDIKRVGGSAAGVLQVLNPTKSGGSISAMRCLVLRMEFAHGIGTVRPLTLGSTLLNVDGGGTVNLAEETLSLVLQSRATVAGAAVAVPVNVFGPLSAPQTKVNEVGIAQSNAAALGGLLTGTAGALVGGGARPGTGDSCPAALAMARGGAAPATAAPAPASAPAPSPAPAPAAPKAPNPGQLLRRLVP